MLTKLFRGQPYFNTEPLNHYANKGRGVKKKTRPSVTSKYASAANLT